MFDSHGYGPVKTTVKVTDPDGSVRTFQPNIQHAGDRAIVAVSPDGPPAPFLGTWCRGEGGGLPPPGAFDLGEPADGTGLAEPGDVRFTWGESTGAGVYSLELDGKVVADTAATGRPCRSARASTAGACSPATTATRRRARPRAR